MSVSAATCQRSVPGFWRRLAAMAYESLLLLGVLSVTFMLPHLAVGMAFGMVLPGWLLLMHVFLVLGIYFVWYWHHGGQTLAMQTWKIRLSAAEHCGEPPVTRLALRYVLAWPSIICFGAGLFWALVDREGQFLHDRLAGTRLMFKA